MSRAATSIFVYGCYMLVLALTLFAIPDVVANLFGLPAHKDVWLYVTAMTVMSLGGYYIAASRDEATDFLRISIILRYAFRFIFRHVCLAGADQGEYSVVHAPRHRLRHLDFARAAFAVRPRPAPPRPPGVRTHHSALPV